MNTYKKLVEKIELRKGTDPKIKLTKKLSPEQQAAAVAMKTAKINVMRAGDEAEAKQGYRRIIPSKGARRARQSLGPQRSILAHSEMNQYERIYKLITEIKVTVGEKTTGSTRPTAAMFKSDKETATKTADTEHGQRQGTRQLKKAAKKAEKKARNENK